MKRLSSSSGSMGALISVCPVSEEHSPGSNLMYMHSREYQSMLDGLDDDDEEESGHLHVMGKKRRLSLEQVNALEKNFEVENKLEPERKVKLAQDLGLQPRQVAVWFQNRRARWKTKQLERDYGILKAKFDSLQHNYDSLQLHKVSLLDQIKELNSKLNEENTEGNMCVQEEALISDSANNTKDVHPTTPPSSLSGGSDDATLLNTGRGVAHSKDGPSESDSSAVLNEENNSPKSNSSCDGGFIRNHQELLLVSPNSPPLSFNYSSSSINCSSFTDSKSEGLGSSHIQNNNVYQPHLVKLEEHNFFSGEEVCNFFSDEAAPTLHWYSPDQWNY